jgi:hypothetical protein
MSEEARLDDNEICMSGAPRTEVTGVGAMPERKILNIKSSPPLAETVASSGALQGMRIFTYSSPDPNRPT